MQRLTDRISGVFVPVVLVIAIATFIGWAAFAGDARGGLVAAVAVLIIACPCALGLATPIDAGRSGYSPAGSASRRGSQRDSSSRMRAEAALCLWCSRGSSIRSPVRRRSTYRPNSPVRFGTAVAWACTEERSPSLMERIRLHDQRETLDQGHALLELRFNIDEELEEVDGVSKSKTSHRKQTTEVEFDETRTGVDKIHETIKGLGYEVAS